MKHKSRSGNPLAAYRRIQREIRVVFDPFTAEHCPTCTTPCCIKPTRVTPVDVCLAEGTGHTFPHLEGGAENPAMEYAAHRLSQGAIGLAMAPADPDVREPCDYLVGGRCSFPNDLRPFGCTTYLCGPMYRHLPDAQIRKLRRLIRDLDVAHAGVLRGLRGSGRMPVEDDDAEDF